MSFVQLFFSLANRSIVLGSLLTRLFFSGPTSVAMCVELTAGDVARLNIESQQIAVHFDFICKSQGLHRIQLENTSKLIITTIGGYVYRFDVNSLALEKEYSIVLL